MTTPADLQTCRHGTDVEEELTAAKQLTALPTLAPLALDVGGPPPSSTAAVQQHPPRLAPFVSSSPSPPLPWPQSLPPPPRSPRALPQDPAGLQEDVEDIEAVMAMTGGGGGPAGAIDVSTITTKQQQQQQQQQEPPTPAAATATAARPLPSPTTAAAATPSRELPATPPSSPVHEHRASSWQAASRRRVAAARPGIFAVPCGGESSEASVAAPAAPAWLARWPVTAPELLLCARDAVATGVHESPLLPNDEEEEQEGDGHDHQQPPPPPPFRFSAPFVELPLKGFRKTMQELDLDAAFDVSAQAFAFTLDPLEEGRVWFFTRPVSKFVRQLRAGAPVLPAIAPSGQVIVSPPQVSSVKFRVVAGRVEEQGQRGAKQEEEEEEEHEATYDGSAPPPPPLPLPPVRLLEFTYGYVVDRFQGEDTGGLGGAFGILYAAGRPFPFPEGRPWQRSWQQRLFNSYGAAGKMASWLVDRAVQALSPWGAPVATSRNAP